MKSLTQYIQEASVIPTDEVYRLNTLIAKYIVKPSNIILQAPETYTESDIQIYIGDIWLNELPSSQKYSEEFFGVNKDSILNAYFEYDRFSHSEDKPENPDYKFIEWDPKYDSKSTTDETKLNYFILNNIRYIIEFDRFDLIGVDDNTVRNQLVKIFSTTSSNSLHKYPIEIKFDANSLVYKK